jgi:leucyl-tRNA synthetase
MDYNFREIEKKWQQFWKDSQTYKVDINGKPKYYVLDMFPYPSGAGLHVGHPLGYIASDIYSRFKRLQGFNVLHPMGYDAYGLPAEQYAIQTGQHPAVTTEKNIARYREQLDKIGFCYDWSREVRTCNPDFYKWTQWAFIQMFNSYYCLDEQQARPISELIEAFSQVGTEGINIACTNEISFTAAEWNAKTEAEQRDILMNYRIAYKADTMVNWCPALGTVLANDEVSEGVSVRGGHPVEQKVMSQWSLRVSAYAQRLLDGLDTIDWTDSLKETQRNWIGRSEGAEITFQLVLPTSDLSPNPSPQERGINPKGNFKCSTNAHNWKFLIEIAKEFRSNQTEAETILWEELRAGKIGYKIRRQHIVDGYVADFINLEKSLIIEVDGGVHLTPHQKEKDQQRTQILNDFGFTVIGFTNEEVKANPKYIASQIKIKLDELSLLQIAPLPCGEGRGEVVVFTTRADTVFGVTFMVLAPESSLVAQLTTPDQKDAVDAYLTATKKRTERERIADKKVSGVFSGSYAINPLTGDAIPVWISDYVLAGYGTGAIMAVPAHDSRDYAFAKHFGLPIVPLIEGCDVSEESFDAKEGIVTNSPAPGKGIPGGLVLNGLTVKEAIAKTKQYIAENDLGRVKVNFRLRDAIFSRQRYWGEPFPVYYKDGQPYMIDESRLPLELPEVDKYLPTEKGEPPLGRAKNWQTEEGYPLELNTMPGFAGSSAYYLRYMDPRNDKALVDKEVNGYWRNVDLYIGGTEHATGHLIYSRFWNKFLFDLGLVCEEEPFKKLINQGMIQGRSNFVYRIKDTNTFVSLNLKSQYEVTPIHVDVNIVSNDILDIEAFKNWNPEYKTAEFILEDGKYVCGWAVEKMSKSMFNVVNPDDIVEKYGADTLRLYEMFLGPLEQSKPWDTNGIDGVHRFLKKLWSLFWKEDNFLVAEAEPTAEELKALHKLLKKIKADIESFSFNTSVSAFMICVNELTSLKCSKKAILEPLVVTLAPFAPHVAEELWRALGNTTTVCDAQWVEADEKYLVENTATYAISFNGKVRYQLQLPADMPAAEVEATVMRDDQAQKWLEGKTPKKVIVVPKKIVNIVL